MCPKIRWDGMDENFLGGKLNRALVELEYLKQGKSVIKDDLI